jgi:hypothetical protein
MYNLYEAILLLNTGFLLIGFATFVYFAPELYEQPSRKFLLGLFIMITEIINLIYLVSFPPS